MATSNTAMLGPGTLVAWQEATWRVVAMTPTTVSLRPDDGTAVQLVVTTELLTDPGFRVLIDDGGLPAPQPAPDGHAGAAIRDVLDAHQRTELDRKLAIVALATEGRVPGQPPDPELVDLNQAERRAVLANRYQVGDRTIKRWIADFRTGGVGALADKRLLDAATPWTGIDARWREAFRVVLDRQRPRTRVTADRIIELVREEAAARFAEDPPDDVSDRQMRRYLDVLRAPRGRHASGKNQRTYTSRPAAGAGWRPIFATRAGQFVALDTNTFDAFALNPVTCQWQQLHLLLALDLYTRTIVGWRFTGWAPAGEDVSLLMAHVATPKLARPGWPAAGAWRYTGVPETFVRGLLDADPLLGSDDARDPGLAGIPVLIPDAFVLDHGKDYLSTAARSAAAVLGASVEMGRPYTPTDKAHVERVFGTIRTGFVQRLPGYKGPDLHARGTVAEVEQDAFYTLDEINDLFAAWVAIEYHNAPHAGLQHPDLPGVELTPNQMFDLSLAHAGHIPVPVDNDLRIELLSTRWRIVDNEGISCFGLKYDIPHASFLDDYRGRPSPFTGPPANGAWRIKIDTADLSQVWFFAYDTPEDPVLGQGSWEPIPVRGLPGQVPFGTAQLAYAKRVVAAAGGDIRSRDAVVKELRGHLRALMGPTEGLSAAEKRSAARADAQRRADAVRGRDTLLDTAVFDVDDDTYYTDPGRSGGAEALSEEPSAVVVALDDDVEEVDLFDEPDFE